MNIDVYTCFWQKDSTIAVLSHLSQQIHLAHLCLTEMAPVQSYWELTQMHVNPHLHDTVDIYWLLVAFKTFTESVLGSFPYWQYWENFNFVATFLDLVYIRLFSFHGIILTRICDCSDDLYSWTVFFVGVPELMQWCSSDLDQGTRTQSTTDLTLFLMLCWLKAQMLWPFSVSFQPCPFITHISLNSLYALMILCTIANEITEVLAILHWKMIFCNYYLPTQFFTDWWTSGSRSERLSLSFYNQSWCWPVAS